MKTNKEPLRSAMDRRLSFLDELPSCRAALHRRIAQEEAPVMKKKLSVGLVFAIVLVLLTVAALAAGNGVTGFGGAGGGTIVYNVSLTKSGIIEHIMTQNAVMNNKLVPKKNRVLYIKESEFIKCKLADQIVGTGATLQDVAKSIIVVL